MVFKSSRSPMFYKIGVLKNFAEFHMKVAKVYNSNKKDSIACVFL